MEAAGGLDEDYFLYCEDADLCLRLVLLGYGGLYEPGARAYHAWAASTGRSSDEAHFYSVRNGLTTLLKDMPLALLLRSLPKIVLYQSYILSASRADGHPRTVTRAWRSFLKTVPSTLRKRRRVMRRRAISSGDFEAVLLTDYPVPTKLSREWLAGWLRRRITGPVKRFGGDLLEHVPEPVRPRIRDRDKRG